MAELMKGLVWEKAKHRITYPVLVEPKVDEIRVHVKRVGSGYALEAYSAEFLSYAGKPLYNLGEWAEALINAMWDYGVTELDCGVLVNDSFADTYRYVRSSKGIPQDLQDAPVTWHLYDLPEAAPDEAFPARYEDRRILLHQIKTRLQERCCEAVVLPAYFAIDETTVLSHYEMLREQGFEGAMVKDPEHEYQRGKRSVSWLKLKPEADADGKITGFVEAVCGKDQPELGLRVGDPLGRIGSVTVRVEDGTWAAPHGIPHELGRDMFQQPEKYLGQWCEFKYMERDRQGGYRHPTFHRLREAKE